MYPKPRKTVRHKDGRVYGNPGIRWFKLGRESIEGQHLNLIITRHDGSGFGEMNGINLKETGKPLTSLQKAYRKGYDNAISDAVVGGLLHRDDLYYDAVGYVEWVGDKKMDEWRNSPEGKKAYEDFLKHRARSGKKNGGK